MTDVAVRETRTPSYVRSTSSLLVASLVAQVLVALVLALVARQLGRSGFGIVVVILSVASIGQDLGDFGTSQWVCRELASGAIMASQAGRLLLDRLVLVCGVSLAAAALASAVGQVGWATALGTAVYVCGAIANAGMHARLRAEGRFRRSAIHIVVERVAWLCATAVLLRFWSDDPRKPATIVAAMGIMFGLSALLASDRAPGATSRIPLTLMYRRSAAFGAMGLTTDVQQLDVAAAAYFASAAVAGEVAAASKFTAPAGLVASNMGTVLFRDVAAGGNVAAVSKGSARRLALALAGLVLLCAPVAPLAITHVLGKSYEHARLTVVLYMLGRAVAVLNQFMASVLTATGRERPVTVVIIIAAALGLLGGVAFVGRWGSASLGLGFVVTQVIVAAGCFRLLQHEWAAVPRRSRRGDTRVQEA